MSEPTPTPWKLRPTKKSGATYTHEIEDALGNFVGAFDVSYGLPAMHEANAAFIVTSCNSHAALRAACKAVVTAMENNAKYGEVCPFCAEPVDGHAGRCVMQWVFKAIDAAEGRPA